MAKKRVSMDMEVRPLDGVKVVVKKGGLLRLGKSSPQGYGFPVREVEADYEVTGHREEGDGKRTIVSGVITAIEGNEEIVVAHEIEVSSPAKVPLVRKNRGFLRWLVGGGTGKERE